MREHTIQPKTAYRLWALAAFAILLAASVLTLQTLVKAEKTDEYPVVILGDSLLGLCRDATSVSAVLQDQISVPVFNGAFGGTYVALQEQEIISNYNMELMNLVSLSKSMMTGDFAVQQTVRSKREITDYFGNTIDDLDRLDLTKTKVLILAFGINDYHAGIPLDNDADPFDEKTFGGALRSVITALLKKYPDTEIYLVTPTFAWYRANHLTCEEYVMGDFFLEDYVNTELAIAQEYSIHAVDLYHDVYPHEEWEDWQTYTIDGLHPNEAGRRCIAEILAERIKEKL